MRERLVAAFVGLTVVIVALYGIPRAYFLADLVRSQEQEQVDQMVQVVAVAVDQRRAAAEPVDPAFLNSLSTGTEMIVVVGPKGAVLASIDGAPDSDDDLVARHDLADGGSVTVARSGDSVGDDVARALLPLVLIGLILVLGAGLIGVLIARRLARPFQELADAARGLGTGELHPDLPRYRVPEAQEIGEALRASGARLDALLEHERELATRASHELRTPLTVLRLELEDLAQWPETPPAVAAELQRSTEALDALSTAITALLDRAREQLTSEAIDLDLDALVADTVARLVQDGRNVVHLSAGVLPTHLDPQPVVQVIELILDEISDDRQVQIQTRSRDNHFEIRIPAAPEAGVAPRATPAWDQAVSLAAASGGQLGRDADHAAVLHLPKRPLAGTNG